MQPSALRHYESFYKRALNICVLYPQYYRFVLRMVIDLEDLGMNGTTSDDICALVIDDGLVDFETSDTRRLESLYLLRQRRNDVLINDRRSALLENVDRFINLPKLFGKLNKPLCYDLTHLVFFLTEYGKKPWTLSNSIDACLMNVGVLALLDNDIDLLSEVCICLRFLGKQAPQSFLQVIDTELSKVEISYFNEITSVLNSSTDEYHPYLVANWLLALEQKPCFTIKFSGRKPVFTIPQNGASALSAIASIMHDVFVLNTKSTQQAKAELSNLPSQHSKTVDNAIKSYQGASSLIASYTHGILI